MIKIGIIGCGSIGSILAKSIEKDKDFKLSYLYDLKREKAIELAKKIQKKPKIVKEIKEMFDSDLIIEAASQKAVKEYALGILDHCDLMIMSVGVFANENLFNKVKEKAKLNNKKVYLPSGAILGLDGVKAASEGKIKKAILITRKPPKSLAGAPYILEKKIDLEKIKKPTLIFEGSAKKAAVKFPKNINVSVALSLAGIGVKKTKVKIIADPSIKRNIHQIIVEGDFGKLETKSENLPLPSNPKTSYLAALSAIKTLKKIKENIILGT